MQASIVHPRPTVDLGRIQVMPVIGNVGLPGHCPGPLRVVTTLAMGCVNLAQLPQRVRAASERGGEVREINPRMPTQYKIQKRLT